MARVVRDIVSEPIQPDDFVLAHVHAAPLVQGYIYQVDRLAKEADGNAFYIKGVSTLTAGNHVIKVMNYAGKANVNVEKLTEELVKLNNARPRNPTPQEILALLEAWIVGNR